MKIIFLVSNLGCGGAERTVAYLSDYMAERGWDVTVLSAQNVIFYELNEKINTIKLNIPYIQFNKKNIFKWFINRMRRTRLIHRNVKSINPDAVFCILPNIAVSILRLHRRKNFKLITSERTLPTQNKKKTKVFNQSDGVVFQTNAAMSFYPENIRAKGTVIHNAVGNPYIHKIPAITERAKKISAMGRLSKEKDYFTLLDAFKLVSEKHPDYTLEIFGDGEEKNNLVLYAEKQGLKGKVFFCESRPDALLQISNSSCYVLSSKFEGMPNALMEAMAVGLPCVSTDCPNGPSELIVNGENGLLVPVGDAEAMSKAILSYIESPLFAECCGRAAREILKTHSIESKAREYMNFIERICK